MQALGDNLADKRVNELFEVHSGDFHATRELDAGSIPLISCGDTNNGLVGYFDVPNEYLYQRCITVAYNGSWPLMAKYHPYQFGAKDDVAVLIPRKDMRDATLLYIAALLNRMTWRHSYGRKCFKEKLQNVQLSIPVANGSGELDESVIAELFPKELSEFIPKRSNTRVVEFPPLAWQSFGITELFDLERGDFHSLTALAEGEFTTVSRTTAANGVVGSFERPDGTTVYGRGHITVSTVGGDAFVQLEDFIATDNIIVCIPKTELRVTTLFFIAFMLNHQKWRYGYGRQPYKAKLEKAKIHMPVTSDGQPDESVMEPIVKQASYWQHVEKRFEGVELFGERTRRTAQGTLPGL